MNKHHCVVCNRETGMNAIHAMTGRHLRADGEVYEDYANVDLCPPCAHDLLRKMVSAMDVANTQAWHALVMQQKKVTA